MPCLPCVIHSSNGAFLLPFLQHWTMETEQLPSRDPGSLQRQSMTDALCYQQSLDTSQRLCFHSLTSFRGYLTKKKKSFATVLTLVLLWSFQLGL